MMITKNIILKRTDKKPILVDVFYKDNNTPKPIIIFCHGYKGFKDWGAWDLMANAFAEADFFFIKFNFSHNGGTTDQPIDFPDLTAFGQNNYTTELDDLNDVIDWIYTSTVFKPNTDVENMSLLGHSRGGGIVLLKAGEDTRIKQVISLAGVSDFGKRFATMGDLDKWKEDGTIYVINGRTKQKMPHFYQFYEDFIANASRLNIEQSVEQLNIPVLLIHGNADTSVLIKEAYNLKQWNPDSTLRIIDEANHVFGASHPWHSKQLPPQLEEVISLIIQFLNSGK